MKSRLIFLFLFPFFLQAQPMLPDQFFSDGVTIFQHPTRQSMVIRHSRGSNNFGHLTRRVLGDAQLSMDLIQAEYPVRVMISMVSGPKPDVEGASYLSFQRDPDGKQFIRYRSEDQVTDLALPKDRYVTIQLRREGNQVSCFAAHPGEPLQELFQGTFPNLEETMMYGISTTSAEAEEADVEIQNIRLEGIVPDDYDAGESGYLPSRLEVIDVALRRRRIVHESDSRLEAPNWMPDGEQLLFNQDGKLWTIPLSGGEPEELNTGFADRNNNDHGISFNGKMLAISHHRDGLPSGGSTVYVLPLEGGQPTLVTELTPSYWHGWNPNDQEVLYVAKRPETGDSYHIFAADIETGVETQITNYRGSHVDGPEYSPDGEWIYYNCNVSGTMQLWRRKPDGSEVEQLTFDANNNWFPHISPDGKWVVYLAYPSTIDVDSHPTYKQVELRLMPTSGGAPRTIAYLFGGQGTINVPSWSPDSRQVAFASYTRKLD